jgi:hypothetical protein
MKRLCLSLALAALSLPGVAATAVGVSIGIDQPGVYGRIDIGRAMAPPMLMYPQPMVIVPTPVAVVQQPIYLRVPPAHAGDWRRHCGYYAACGQPVYFVREDWYQRHYRVEREDWHEKQHGHGHGHEKHGG